MIFCFFSTSTLRPRRKTETEKSKPTGRPLAALVAVRSRTTTKRKRCLSASLLDIENRAKERANITKQNSKTRGETFSSSLQLPLRQLVLEPRPALFSPAHLLVRQQGTFKGLPHPPFVHGVVSDEDELLLRRRRRGRGRGGRRGLVSSSPSVTPAAPLPEVARVPNPAPPRGLPQPRDLGAGRKPEEALGSDDALPGTAAAAATAAGRAPVVVFAGASPAVVLEGPQQPLRVERSRGVENERRDAVRGGVEVAFVLVAVAVVVVVVTAFLFVGVRVRMSRSLFLLLLLPSSSASSAAPPRRGGGRQRRGPPCDASPPPPFLASLSLSGRRRRSSGRGGSTQQRRRRHVASHGLDDGGPGVERRDQGPRLLERLQADGVGLVEQDDVRGLDLRGEQVCDAPLGGGDAGELLEGALVGGKVAGGEALAAQRLAALVDLLVLECSLFLPYELAVATVIAACFELIDPVSNSDSNSNSKSKSTLNSKLPSSLEKICYK